MSDLCLCRNDSKSSRNVIFSLPAEAYAFELGTKVNLTLQAMWERVVQDFNDLAENGVWHEPLGEPLSTYVLLLVG
jgi:hypothetical protein